MKQVRMWRGYGVWRWYQLLLIVRNVTEGRSSDAVVAVVVVVVVVVVAVVVVAVVVFISC